MENFLERKYDLYSQGRSGWTPARGYEEYQEEDVWAICNDRNDYDLNFVKKSYDIGSRFGSSDSSTVTPKRVLTAARMISRSSNNSTQELKLAQQSAPVNIPDWSKIYGKNNTKKASRNVSFNDDIVVYDGNNVTTDRNWDSDEDSEKGELDGRMTMPPHEWITKKLESTKVSSFSVCEGAGRTLKGRDLSRVRNAVLTRTGFLE